MASLLNQFAPSNVDDVHIWKREASGCFSVKTALSTLQQKRRIVEEALCNQILGRSCSNKPLKFEP